VFTGGRCNEDRTDALDGDGNLVEECAPYFCVNGRCEDACVSTSDCQPGFLCDTAQERCVSESDNEATNEGCGCRVTTNQRGKGFIAAWLLFALAIWARRRRA
jgi:MYXO-CTERM domain-containing protein